MVTFKTCIRAKKRADNLYPVYTRITHHRKIGYIKTEKVVDKSGIRKGEIKDTKILSYCTNFIKSYNTPNMEMTDSQINMIAKNYYQDENFTKEGNSINMWRVYNLLTGANKSSYIDNFLDRSLNTTQLTEGLSRAVQGDSQYR